MADAKDIEKRVDAKKKALLYEMVVLGSLMFPAFEYAKNGRITVPDVIFTTVVLIAGIGLVSRISRSADKPEKGNLNDRIV
jgi:hypothetical protein